MSKGQFEVWINGSLLRQQIVVLPQSDFTPGEKITLVCKESGETVETEVVMATLRFRERALFGRMIQAANAKLGDALYLEDAGNRKGRRVINVSVLPKPAGRMEAVKQTMLKKNQTPPSLRNLAAIRKAVYEDKTNPTPRNENRRDVPRHKTEKQNNSGSGRSHRPSAKRDVRQGRQGAR